MKILIKSLNNLAEVMPVLNKTLQRAIPVQAGAITVHPAMR